MPIPERDVKTGRETTEASATINALAARAEALTELAAERRTAATRFVELHRRLLQAGVPSRAAKVIICEGFDSRAPAIETVAQWSKRVSGTFVISGDRGTSKTCAGAVFLRNATSAGRTILWHDAVHTPHIDFATWDGLFRRLIAVERLVIDDVGAPGTTTKLATDRISNVILSRCGSTTLSTLLVTNHGREHFGRLYDGGQGRILDRIREDGGWLSTRGRSRRGSPPDLSKVDEMLRQASSFLELCERVARGSTRWAELTKEDLDALQQRIEVSEERLQQRTAEIQTMSAKTREVLDGILSRRRTVL